MINEIYIPAEWIAGIMGRGNAWAIITAALLGYLKRIID
jgi:hypothetical protein